jgi:hypothetical protein
MGFDATDVLINHLTVCVRDALPEFADLSWLRRHLRRVAESDPSTCDAMLRIGEPALLELMIGLLSMELSPRKPWVLIPMLEIYAEMNVMGKGAAPMAADVVRAVAEGAQCSLLVRPGQ